MDMLRPSVCTNPVVCVNHSAYEKHTKTTAYHNHAVNCAEESLKKHRFVVVEAYRKLKSTLELNQPRVYNL